MSRIQSQIELLRTAKKCAIKADIYQYMFLGYGTLLGAVRPTWNPGLKKTRRGFMYHDSDCDLCFLSDRFSLEQREAYYKYCVEAGLMSGWPNPNLRQKRRDDDNSLLWFSIKRKKQKSCNWMQIEHEDLMLHGKGPGWLNEQKFPSRKWGWREKDKAIMKAVPKKYFWPLIEIDFEGERFNVPLQSGSLLDIWYPAWHAPKKGGASKKSMIVVIKDWARRSTWRTY